jgi:hypothetical protein
MPTRRVSTPWRPVPLRAPAGFLDETLVDLLAGAASEKAQRREASSPLLGSGTERDLELLDDGLRFVVLVVELGLVVDRDIQLCGVVLVDDLTNLARVLLFDVVDQRGCPLMHRGRR